MKVKSTRSKYKVVEKGEDGKKYKFKAKFDKDMNLKKFKRKNSRSLKEDTNRMAEAKGAVTKNRFNKRVNKAFKKLNRGDRTATY